MFRPSKVKSGVNQTIHRGPTFNDILPKQCAIYVNNRCKFRVSQFEVRWKILILNYFCMLIWLWYKCLPFGAVPVGDMLQCKIDEIFSDMANVLGIMDDILAIGYNEGGADHDAAVPEVLCQCEELILKLNTEKCHFSCMSILFLERWYLEKEFSQIHKNQSVLMDLQCQRTKKNCRPFKV